MKAMLYFPLYQYIYKDLQKIKYEKKNKKCQKQFIEYVEYLKNKQDIYIDYISLDEISK